MIPCENEQLIKRNVKDISTQQERLREHGHNIKTNTATIKAVQGWWEDLNKVHERDRKELKEGQDEVKEEIISLKLSMAKYIGGATVIITVGTALLNKYL